MKQESLFFLKFVGRHYLWLEMLPAIDKWQKAVHCCWQWKLYLAVLPAITWINGDATGCGKDVIWFALRLAFVVMNFGTHLRSAFLLLLPNEVGGGCLVIVLLSIISFALCSRLCMRARTPVLFIDYLSRVILSRVRNVDRKWNKMSTSYDSLFSFNCRWR